MRVIDTYSELIVLLDKMNGSFDIDLWKNYAFGIAKNLPEKLQEDSKEYNFDAEILPVLSRAVNHRDVLAHLHNSFLAVTMNIGKRCQKAFQADLDVDIILYLGLCNGAGWATLLDGKKTVLLGVEKIMELHWFDEKSMTGLIYHELGHILHDVNGAESCHPLTPYDKSVWQLYREGMAGYCEQLLCGDVSSYHQNKGDWLDWCVYHQKEILHEYRKRLRNKGSTQDFFGDWAQWRGRSDLGYFLGCEFAKSLAPRYTLKELLTLGLPEIKREFDRYTL